MKRSEEVAYVASPIGTLRVVGSGGAVVRIDFAGKKAPAPAPRALRKAAEELRSYFKTGRGRFSFEMKMAGTPFQKRVWKELSKLGCGRTVSYSEIARRVGRPKAVRAVASAIGANPICVAVPCHRVIAKDGGIAGYAGGVHRKRRLLALEGLKDFT